MRRMSLSGIAGQAALVLVLGVTHAAPVRAQIARVRTAAPDAPKMLIVPFQRDSVDSTLAVGLADGFRDRIQDAWLTRFNPILKDGMNRALVESGFPTEVPLDHNVVIQLARFLNAKLLVEGNILQQSDDSLLIIARLSEAVGALPQSATASVTVARSRADHGTGASLANRLADAYRSFADVQQCRDKVQAQDYGAATRAAEVALERYPNSSSALLCLANVARAQHASQDSIVALLRRAASVDSLNTTVRRQLAQIYEQQGDTAALIDQLRHILNVDVSDRELRIRTAQLYVQIGEQKGDTSLARMYADSAVQLVDQGLARSPADLDLLTTKSIALAVAHRWAQAAEQLETVASADTARVDSLFVFRIINYYRAIPDSTKWFAWLRRATTKFPHNAGYMFDLSSVALSQADTNTALDAARRYQALQPADLRANLLIARVLTAQGQVDSARAYALPVGADTLLRHYAAAFFIQSGAKALHDSAWARAADDLDTARTWSVSGSDNYITASFYEGIAQLQLAVQADQRANGSRGDCADVQLEKDYLNRAQANIIAGAARNRDQANNLLSNVIPAFQQRADAFTHNYKCPSS